MIKTCPGKFKVRYKEGKLYIGPSHLRSGIFFGREMRCREGGYDHRLLEKNPILPHITEFLLVSI